jgi:homoserine kinase type II
MLWETVDANRALAQRFRFASTQAATNWLATVLSQSYGVQVVSVDRLLISSTNLLAWLTTTHGPLIAKCCGSVGAHGHLLALGEFVVWLARQGLPVSAPLAAQPGEVQVARDHLSLGVQRLMPGNLLEPGHLEQAYSAGMTLAQLHEAFAAYPRIHELAQRPIVPTLKTTLHEWVAQKRAAISEPALAAGVQLLEQRLDELGDGALNTQAVHNDFRAANILWNDGKICAVLDFEDLRWGYRANDLAWAAVHLGTRYRNWGPVSTAVHEAFLAGYQAIQPLTGVEEAWLPLLMAWHSINLAHAWAGSPTYAACVDSANTCVRLLSSAGYKRDA